MAMRIKRVSQLSKKRVVPADGIGFGAGSAKMFFEEIEVDGHRMRRFEQVG